MSLNLTIVNQFGMWQCSDHRLVNTATMQLHDDESVKQVQLKCRDGSALIAYAGVGELNGVQVSDWIRELLRGESRTVDESLMFLRENATRDLGPYLRGRLHHMFTVAAVFGGRRWLAQIRNFDPTPSNLWARPLGVFRTVAVEVTAGIATVFPPLLTAQDRALLTRVATRRPRDPKQFAELLATINRRVASGPARRVVSAHCVTSHTPPTGEPFEVKFHDASGQVRHMQVPMLLFGIDTTEMMRGLMSRVPGGQPIDLPQQGQLAVTPVNRLRRP
jgi:hypothetical protein